MTLPAILTTLGHVHVTEREVAHTWPNGWADDGIWEDCVFSSGVMLARLGKGVVMPPTHTEAEALRRAAGLHPLLGASAADLLRGFAARYRWTTNVRSISAAGLWTALVPGTAAALLGSMSGFPAGYTLRRWDPGYRGGHAVLGVRLDEQDRVWWDDPLAPVGTYQGQWVSKADVLRFVRAGGLSCVVAPLRSTVAPAATPLREVDVTQAAITAQTPVLVDVAPGAPLFDLDGTTKVTVVGGAGIKGRLSPYAVGTKRAIAATVNGVTKQYLATPVKTYPVVDASPFTQAQIDAAKTAAIAAERTRVRHLLGLE